MKKPSVLAQEISLKQGKALAFLKTLFYDLEISHLSPSNFRICRLTSKTTSLEKA